MKNASFLLICCILLAIILPVALKKQGDLSIDKKALEEHYLTVLDITNDTIFRMPLDEYVWRVAAMEIPITFQDEAIKAQMVAARTYALRKMGANTHKNNADVCTDYSHCTAFLLPGEEKNKFKNNYKKYCNRLQNLEKSTQNQILTFDDEPILAVFHAISSGKTEKSSDVWQTQLPYLVSVDSTLDKNADGFETTYSFSEEELKKVFGINSPPNFEITSFTDAGSVKTIKVNGKTYSGTEIRKLLNLRSINFFIERKENTYIFYVKGYGHGVGMSQAGANEYAKSGMNYKDILKKYYQGTCLTYINNLPHTSNTTK